MGERNPSSSHRRHGGLVTSKQEFRDAPEEVDAQADGGEEEEEDERYGVVAFHCSGGREAAEGRNDGWMGCLGEWACWFEFWEWQVFEVVAEEGGFRAGWVCAAFGE